MSASPTGCTGRRAAARANHAVVYLNDELYGVPTVIDTVDDVFLKRWYDAPGRCGNSTMGT